MRTVLMAAMTLALAAVCATPGVASAEIMGGGDSVTGINASGLADANVLQVRQYKIDSARLPGPISSRQTVTAWQVTQGSWNGQTLDGLVLVLVQSTAENGQGAGQTNCYVSHFATAAQRAALVNAFLATQPQAIGPNEAARMRVEPAVITIEVEGQMAVLHLGLIA